MIKPHVLFLFLSFFFTGCIQRIAVSTVGDIVYDGFSGFMEEEDLVFAAEALPANLKLLEVMLKSDPENQRILTLLGEGYSSYALGFVEDDDPVRARDFYLRGYRYALRILEQEDGLMAALEGPADRLSAVLENLGRDHVPAAFWTAFGLGSFINLSLSDPDALAQLPRVEALMEFVAEKDSTFYNGGADIFLGTLFGSRPRILGGDTERARMHFERALRINGGTFLMTQVYYARSVAVQTQNEGLFEELLAAVEKAALDVKPEYRLPNAIAKAKAARLMQRRAELF
jgi:hypothetical protein